MNDRQKYNNNNSNGIKENLEIEYAKRGQISLHCNEISMLSRVKSCEVWQQFAQ